jgi:hypothetical protein
MPTTPVRIPSKVASATALGGLIALLVAGYAVFAGGATAAGKGSGGRPGSAPSLAPIEKPYKPKVPSKFVRTVDNRYWPLKPGTAFHYRGVRGHTRQTDNELVTHKTKKIIGITATVVRDTVRQNGKRIERTFDWYAQDKYGNVWYLGELSLERKHGHMVRASDSWKSGVNGGKPAIIMPGHPRVGDRYRQEYYPPGEALDQARVLSLHGTTTAPYRGTEHGLLVTSERSPLEPQTEQKYYDPGLGEVKEKVVRGHHEVFSLVAISH